MSEVALKQDRDNCTPCGLPGLGIKGAVACSIFSPLPKTKGVMSMIPGVELGMHTPISCLLLTQYLKPTGRREIHPVYNAVSGGSPLPSH